jgi:hypothetical protein
MVSRVGFVNNLWNPSSTYNGLKRATYVMRNDGNATLAISTGARDPRGRGETRLAALAPRRVCARGRTKCVRFPARPLESALCG